MGTKKLWSTIVYENSMIYSPFWPTRLADGLEQRAVLQNDSPQNNGSPASLKRIKH